MAKYVTLHDTDDEIIYPQISTDSVPNNAITGDKLDFESTVGWKYLGSQRLSAVSTSFYYQFPSTKYRFYKIMIAGSFASNVSNQWFDICFYTGDSSSPSYLANTHMFTNLNASGASGGNNSGVRYIANQTGVGNGVDFAGEILLSQPHPAWWQFFKTNISYYGLATKLTNGHIPNTTQPDGVCLLCGGNIQGNSIISVWGFDPPTVN